MKYFNRIIKMNSIFEFKMALHLLVVVLLVISSTFNLSKAQSVDKLENELNGLKETYTDETALLDSLKQMLNKRAKEIDSAKKLDNADEDNIKQLMAATVLIADRIDKQQKKVNGIEKEIEIIKKKLDEKYTKEIDSLYALEASDNYKGNRDDLHNRILHLTEKKVIVAPKIYSLSFNPEKILKLNPTNAKTLEEKNIYVEYLKEALAEVDKHLERVKKLNDEAAQIITLQEKATEFLEDTEFDTDIRTSNLSSSNSRTAGGESPVDVLSETRLAPQVQSFTLLLRQLNLSPTSDIESSKDFSLDSLRTDLTLEEYKNLLNEVEKGLSDYKLILSNKIETSK